ncbi:hypothetical protein D9V32_07595 [Mycetocola tolaasinivorans]|uniref:Uncharacterized protein n=1 Tax=Mycetocola tolaasinivorans TaxID=76635 RepID=A0A3L7A8U8_9MICO|nr:hypothetical protein [Mycetocola tolaasinivorans]RLP76011.1 hypothetical protein D9V32_07595 [Mycetocola tolaasinivorans]
MSPFQRVSYILFIIVGAGFVIYGFMRGAMGGFTGSSLLTAIVLILAGGLVLYRGFRGVRAMLEGGSDDKSDR